MTSAHFCVDVNLDGLTPVMFKLNSLVPSALDPALTDPALHRKLRSNRDVALSSLEEVITKYANKQEDIEVEETRKRQERDRQKKEVKELNIFL